MGQSWPVVGRCELGASGEWATSTASRSVVSYYWCCNSPGRPMSVLARRAAFGTWHMLLLLSASCGSGPTSPATIERSDLRLLMEPSDPVAALLVTADSVLFVGTSSGVLRYDYLTKELDPIVHSETRTVDLAATSASELYVLGETSEIIRWTQPDGQIRVLSRPTLDSLIESAGISLNEFFGLAAISTTDSGVVAVGDEGLILVESGSTWNVLPGPFPDASDPLANDARPTLWDVAVSGGVLRTISVGTLGRLVNGEWTLFHAPPRCGLLSLHAVGASDAVGGGAPPCMFFHSTSKGWVDIGDGIFRLATGFFSDVNADPHSGTIVFWDEGGTYVLVDKDKSGLVVETPLDRLEGVAILGNLTFLAETTQHTSRIYVGRN